MGRPSNSSPHVPAYRLHKQSGQAIVTLSGRDHLLGPHGTAESRAKYDRVVGEWQANGRQTPGQSAGAAIIVGVIIARYWQHAQGYYAGNSSAGELAHVKNALKILRRLYQDTPVEQFGPLSLQAVRDVMIAAGWSRRYVNDQVYRLKRMFAWAVEQELAPPSTHHALLCVRGLRYGRSPAREAEDVQPAPQEQIEPVRQRVSRQVRAMIDLQLLTGMRPGEVCQMRGCDIERPDGGNWTYRPATHKTQHHGHKRFVLIGPRAQIILTPFLAGRDPQAHVFSPSEAEAERRATREKNRKTPKGQGNRADTNRKAQPKRRPAGRYSVGSYRRAIARAFGRAFPATEGQSPPRAWHPHQLRHNAATQLRRDFGLEAAQVILGHATLTVTQVYAEKNVRAAAEIMSRVG